MGHGVPFSQKADILAIATNTPFVPLCRRLAGNRLRGCNEWLLQRIASQQHISKRVTG